MDDCDSETAVSACRGGGERTIPKVSIEANLTPTLMK